MSLLFPFKMDLLSWLTADWMKQSLCYVYSAIVTLFFLFIIAGAGLLREASVRSLIHSSDDILVCALMEKRRKLCFPLAWSHLARGVCVLMWNPCGAKATHAWNMNRIIRMQLTIVSAESRVTNTQAAAATEFSEARNEHKQSASKVDLASCKVLWGITTIN